MRECVDQRLGNAFNDKSSNTFRANPKLLELDKVLRMKLNESRQIPLTSLLFDQLYDQNSEFHLNNHTNSQKDSLQFASKLLSKKVTIKEKEKK